MIDITAVYVSIPRVLVVCPDCGGRHIDLYSDFVWFCQDCGCTVQDSPENYLSVEELIDFKAGMWTPKRSRRKVKA